MITSESTFFDFRRLSIPNCWTGRKKWIRPPYMTQCCTHTPSNSRSVVTFICTTLLQAPWNTERVRRCSDGRYNVYSLYTALCNYKSEWNKNYCSFWSVLRCGNLCNRILHLDGLPRASQSPMSGVIVEGSDSRSALFYCHEIFKKFCHPSEFLRSVVR